MLFDDASRLFVLAQSHKFRMPEPIRICPFQKLDLRNCLGTEPYTLFHFLGSKAFTPTRWMLVRKVDEWHLWRNKMTEFLKDLTT